ncbi:MAG TPA: TnsA endonuclease C-terminal domain-containing protein [Chloroflexia bacterium]|jgi:hypothetical protein
MKASRQESRELARKRTSQGRGQGQGANYQPWLVVREVVGRGTCWRVQGWTVDRKHELFGKLQRWHFYTLDWSAAVIDIREQYPLLPLDSTLDIAKKLGIRHPGHQSRRSPAGVLMVDFMVTKMSNGVRWNEAHMLSYAKRRSEEGSEQTRKVLDIKKRWLEAHGIKVVEITDETLSIELAKNVHMVHKHLDISERVHCLQSELDLVVRTLSEYAWSGMALRDAAKRCEEVFSLPPGSGLAIAYHLIATKRWQINMHVPINASQPLTFLSKPNF